MINLRLLEICADEEGARGLFEQLIAQLVSLKFGDKANARTIEPSPGDWGIDAIVGNLNPGPCIIWQAKYFPKIIKKKQMKQIEDSFNKLIAKSKENNFSVLVWYLCIPSALTNKADIWWKEWSTKKMAETGINIELWHKDCLEKMLIAPEAQYIREAFNLDAKNIKPIEKQIVLLPDKQISTYDNALFIKKLSHAEITEDSVARAQFFNAELIQKEIQARNDPSELNELNGIYIKILGEWQILFDEAMDSPDPKRETKNVYYKMNDLILKEHNEYFYCPKISVSGFHKKGFMHQLSDKCKLGWSPDYKTIAGDT